jgi:hypothetical protein
MSTTQGAADNASNQEVNTNTGSFLGEPTKNSSGFRPIFYNNIAQSNRWMAPQISYYIPAVQGATTLSSPSTTPTLSAQEAPSMLADRWCIGYCQPFCSPISYFPNTGEFGSVGETPMCLVKHEEKTSNSETVHQSELTVR